jgi:amino acid adenylation domain-containing protein
VAYLLHHLLSESAARLPDQEAVRFQGHALSYRQLDRVTNQVARALQAAGVRRGDRVGIYVHKSLASVIAVFGIMKAGAVYVPLDPKAPPKRLAYIARNCDVQLLLTSPDKLPRLAEFYTEGAPIHTVILMEDKESPATALPESTCVVTWRQLQAYSDGRLPSPGTTETDLAYILYTSGSTGDPKGVMISHRTILTFVNWACATFELNASDRVTSHAPLHFDLSTFDLYATIKAGGTVVLVPEQHSVFPIRLVGLLQDEQITVTYMVPSIYSLMVNHGNLAGHDLARLRLILFAGEVFPIKYLRELVKAIPHAAYYNLYGPTETNVCTYYEVQAKDLEPDRAQPVPIGIACENMEVFAVAADGKLVTEPGQEGELWARGSCVAQGYWGDPEKTARGFVPNVYQPHFSEIAYRTGDVVTLDEDGVNWRYVGRRDHMIKSRGYRIELGEIEAALYGHNGVSEAAVVAVPDDLVGNRIKAFVVPVAGNHLSDKELQVFCRQQLPQYMVPEAIYFCDELPKTSTGKVNRTLLLGQAEKNNQLLNG